MNQHGSVIGIYIASRAGEKIVALDSVVAIPGKGLEGDRYFNRDGTFSDRGESGRALTLIESEAIDALERDYGINLPYGEARRNIVTRSIALNHLVGRTFLVGSVLVRGIRLCEPCAHLEKVSGKKVLRGLIHRAGLRADVLEQGMIRVGDAVLIQK